MLKSLKEKAMKKPITHAQIHDFNKLYYKTLGLYARLDSALGVNGFLYKVLYALAISDLHTQKDIAQSYEMPKQTINNIILSLQKQGFVEVQTSPTDKREKLIALTPSGKIYAQDFIAKYTDFEQKVYEKLGAQKLQKLIEIFSDYERAFSEMLGDISAQSAQDKEAQSTQKEQNTQNQHTQKKQNQQNKQNGGAK